MCWCLFHRLLVSEYNAPPAINRPKIIIINGQNSISIPASDVTPTRIIISPIIIPKIVPPCGSPKHSCSVRFPKFSPQASARFPNSSAPASLRFSRLYSTDTLSFAPHFTQYSTESSFFVPHLEQKTIISHFKSISSHLLYKL